MVLIEIRKLTVWTILQESSVSIILCIHVSWVSVVIKCILFSRRQRNITTTHYVSRRELEIASEDKYLGYTPEHDHRQAYCPAEVVTLQTFPSQAASQPVRNPKNGELEPDITKTTVTYGHAASPACTCPMLGETYSSCRVPHRPHTYETPTCLWFCFVF